MDGYSLSRDYWEFAFNNPEKCKPNHAALFFYIIEHFNRMGWKEKTGLPTGVAMEAIGIKSYSVYKTTLDELVEFGFIILVQKSKNQYTANIIALKENYKAPSKAHDKAITKHLSKHCRSTLQSTVSIIKPINNKTKKQIKGQSGEKDKVKKERVSKDFIPPTIDEVKAYFKENGYKTEAAEKAFQYYDVSGWKDAKGDQVKNWKQKMISVWFKPENKEGSPPPTLFGQPAQQPPRPQVRTADEILRERYGEDWRQKKGFPDPNKKTA